MCARTGLSILEKKPLVPVGNELGFLGYGAHFLVTIPPTLTRLLLVVKFTWIKVSCHFSRASFDRHHAARVGRQVVHLNETFLSLMEMSSLFSSSSSLTVSTDSFPFVAVQWFVTSYFPTLFHSLTIHFIYTGDNTRESRPLAGGKM